MLINADEINEVIKKTPGITVAKGKRYFEKGRVKRFEFKYTSDDYFSIFNNVQGTDNYNISIKKEKRKIKLYL